MDVIKIFVVLVIGLLGWKVSNIDFPTLCFYLDIAITLYVEFLKILKITIT